MKIWELKCPRCGIKPECGRPCCEEQPIPPDSVKMQHTYDKHADISLDICGNCNYTASTGWWADYEIEDFCKFYGVTSLVKALEIHSNRLDLLDCNLLLGLNSFSD